MSGRADTPTPEIVGILRERGARSPACGPRDSHPPSLIENDAGSYRGLISFAEQSEEAVCPRFARAKRESVARRRFARAKRESRPRQLTFPEQSAKADRRAWTSSEQSPKVHRAAGLLQSKVRKSTRTADFARAKSESPPAQRTSPEQSPKVLPPGGLRQSKAGKCGPPGFARAKRESPHPATFPEQSAKARHTAFAEQSGEVCPPRGPGNFPRAKRESGALTRLYRKLSARRRRVAEKHKPPARFLCFGSKEVIRRLSLSYRPVNDFRARKSETCCAPRETARRAGPPPGSPRRAPSPRPAPDRRPRDRPPAPSPKPAPPPVYLAEGQPARPGPPAASGNRATGPPPPRRPLERTRWVPPADRTFPRRARAESPKGKRKGGTPHDPRTPALPTPGLAYPDSA